MVRSVYAQKVRGVLSRLLGFSTLPFISMLVPLLALPVVARVGGVAGWAALTVGQAAGGYAAAVAYAGWNVLGTPLVAKARDRVERQRLYVLAFYCRMGALGVAAPVAALVAALLSDERAVLVAIGAALSSAVTALGVSWYAVGVGSPILIAAYDLLPRLLATLACLPIVIATQRVEPYVFGLLLAPLVGLIAFHRREWRRWVPEWIGLRALKDGYAQNRAAWLVEASGNLYSSAPVPMSAAVGGPVVAAGYGSGDRLYRYGLYAVVAFANALQGWVLESSRHSRRRHTIAILIMLTVGAVGAAVLALVGVPAAALVFGQEVAPTQDVMLWLALAYFCVSVSTPLIRNILVPARREKSVLVVTLSSALIGLATMIALGQLWGAPGVAAGLAISELVTAVVCGFLVAAPLRRVSADPSRENGDRAD